MKRIFAFVLATIMCLSLVSCGGSKAKAWNARDFMFYNEAGEVVARLSEDTGWLVLSENNVTHRQVAIGDDAITALKKYDLCYGKSAYGSEEPQVLTKDVDLDGLIATGTEFMIIISFDKNYKPVDTMSLVENNIDPSLMICFRITDGKIAQVLIAGSIEENESSITSSNPSQGPKTYGLNEVVMFENLKFTATEIKESNGTDFFVTAEGNVFVGIKFTIEKCTVH